MPKIVIDQTTPVCFMKNEYLMAKIDVYRSLLPSDRVIGWDIKMTSHPNSNGSFINILDTIAKFEGIVKIGGCTQLLKEGWSFTATDYS